MKIESVRPKLVVLVVYKSKQSHWRGFCTPYDVTCNAETREEAMARLEALVRLYEEGLEKYSYPKHLSIKPITHVEDRQVFRRVKEIVAADIQRSLTTRFNSFQTENVRTFKATSPFATGCYYSQPSPI